MQYCTVSKSQITLQALFLFVLLAALPGYFGNAGYVWASDKSPSPLLEQGHSVDWWFVFKFNAPSFPGCGNEDAQQRQCLFGGDAKNYAFSQQFVYASSETPSLQKGGGCVGGTISDPLGATFDEIYNGNLFYVVWNDQFKDDPAIKGCSSGSCGGPWGHSKGILAWNEAGEGFVLQVTTPSWPAAGNKLFPRKTDGNTLGCIKDDNVKFSQHFFSLKLTKDDLVAVLKALKNASIVTDSANQQIVNNGGPADVQSLVTSLGTKSHNTSIIKVQLSSGVGLISKPSDLPVPPWQMVSSELGSVPLRTATWWAYPQIYSTTATTKITCWDDSLGEPGPVAIATTGRWDVEKFGLKGGENHAKIGVSTAGDKHFSIFGDLNQQGALSGNNCSSSQNGRGGLFYVIDNKVLSDGITSLIEGDTAPTEAPNK